MCARALFEENRGMPDQDQDQPDVVAERRPTQQAAAGSVIWARVDRGARGPQPSLNRRRIARAAIEIADAEGIDAVSMRKVAARLESGTMSLYRYLDRKDDLIDMMVDEVLGEGMRWALSGDWRADLAEVARDIRRVTLRHPWLAGYAMGRPDRKSTRLNFSHVRISYAVFCLKQKKQPTMYLHRSRYQDIIKWSTSHR